MSKMMIPHAQMSKSVKAQERDDDSNVAITVGLQLPALSHKD